MDDRTCPICMALNGYVWTFEAGKDTFGNFLTHPSYGVVWNVNIGSKAHGHGGNCRCHVEPEINLGDLLMRLREIRGRLEDAVDQGDAKGEMMNP
jgi:hypothetical protein